MVLMLTGLGGNESFGQPSRGTNYERLELLVRAMTTMECGVDYENVEVEAIRQGFDLAFPGMRKVEKRPRVWKDSVDIGVSRVSDMKGTTFACWDEYADW